MLTKYFTFFSVLKGLIKYFKEEKKALSENKMPETTFFLNSWSSKTTQQLNKKYFRFISVTPLGLDLQAHPVYLRYLILWENRHRWVLCKCFRGSCWCSNFSIQFQQQEFSLSCFLPFLTSEFIEGTLILLSFSE